MIWILSEYHNLDTFKWCHIKSPKDIISFRKAFLLRIFAFNKVGKFLPIWFFKLLLENSLPRWFYTYRHIWSILIFYKKCIYFSWRFTYNFYYFIYYGNSLFSSSRIVSSSIIDWISACTHMMCHRCNLEWSRKAWKVYSMISSKALRKWAYNTTRHPSQSNEKPWNLPNHIQTHFSHYRNSALHRYDWYLVDSRDHDPCRRMKYCSSCTEWEWYRKRWYLHHNSITVTDSNTKKASIRMLWKSLIIYKSKELGISEYIGT